METFLKLSILYRKDLIETFWHFQYISPLFQVQLFV